VYGAVILAAAVTAVVVPRVALAALSPPAYPSSITTRPTAGRWEPTAQTSGALHWVLEDPLDIDNVVHMGLRDINGLVLPWPDVYDIDGEINPSSTVTYLHSIGRPVICYFDAGVYETYRSDAWKFQAITPRIWGNKDGQWAGSYWLDIRRVSELEPIMKARMQMCKDKGFDSIEPDEIDGWENNTGFSITYQQQLTYNRALAQWAHELDISIGQKGDIIQTQDLVSFFDWTLNEECYRYHECTNPWNPDTGQEQIWHKVLLPNQSNQWH